MEAFDSEDEALTIVLKNMELNQLEKQPFATETFDYVVANVFEELGLQLKQKICQNQWAAFYCIRKTV